MLSPVRSSIVLDTNCPLIAIAIFIATDVACALLPIAFIRKIRRPLREKIVLGVLMGLGLVASACGIVKLIDLERVRLSSQDPSWEGTYLLIWA
jgi:hypothetical protein